MGTYGVTHVKKDDKVIAFSDSHDAYMSGGMGQANVICIKYLSTPILKSLFDKFSASSKVPVGELKTFKDEDDGNDQNQSVSLSARQIEDVVFRVEKDTNNQEAVDWMKGAVGDSIRASMSGFAPLLYLNINNHYARDYDYWDYLVDLDNEEFVYQGVTVPFEKIRSASMNRLDAFCSDARDLLPKEIQFDKNDSLFDETFVNENPEKVKKIIDGYFSIDEAVLDKYYQKRDEERQKWLDARNKEPVPNQVEDDFEEEYLGGYSIHNTEVNAPTLRAILTFMSKLKDAIPESSFLTKNSDWGMNENYSAGGIRFFSPMSNSPLVNRIHEQFVRTVESSFKLRFNIFSSSGKWNSGVEEKEDPIDSLFGGESSGPQQSLYTLKEIENQMVDDPEQREAMFDKVHPNFGFHADYREVRELILNKDSQDEINSPPFWIYFALLNQDEEVFNAVYPVAKQFLSKADQKSVNLVNDKYLQSLSDGFSVNDLVSKFAADCGKEYKAKSQADFIETLKKTTFFNDIKDNMNDFERNKYFSEGNSVGSQKEERKNNKKFK